MIEVRKESNAPVIYTEAVAILNRIDELHERTPHQLVILPENVPLCDRSPQVPSLAQFHNQKHEVLRLDDTIDAENVRVGGDGAVQVNLVVALC